MKDQVRQYTGELTALLLEAGVEVRWSREVRVGLDHPAATEVESVKFEAEKISGSQRYLFARVVPLSEIASVRFSVLELAGHHARQATESFDKALKKIETDRETELAIRDKIRTLEAQLRALRSQ